MPNIECILGTRRSGLAKVQTEIVANFLKRNGVETRTVEIVSQGDADRSKPLYEIEPETPGLFTKQLETALQEQRIDIAVHSLKDLPTTLASGLEVVCIPARHAANDSLIIAEKAYAPKERLSLKKGATVATSSLRREALLKSFRPDLRVVSIRGNVPSRVKAVEEARCDAVVLARAGIERLGLSFSALKRVDIPDSDFVPAPAQGAIAVEARSDLSVLIRDVLSQLHSAQTERETRIERTILKEMLGGCTLPLGVHCRVEGENLKLQVFLGVSKDRHGEKHDWIGFKRFDFSGNDEKALVLQAIQALRK